MIKEDYVSFEVAELLKEKGFDSDDVGCHGGFYSERCYESGQGIKTQSNQEVGIVYDDLTNSELEYDEYLRPTLQMAMKWLREVHNIHVVPRRDFFNRTYTGRIYDGRRENVFDKDDYIALLGYETYEEACDEAIKYSLENLV